MTAALPSPRSIDPDIPEALDRIVTRCIEPDATARYFTTADLIADLEALDEDGHPLPVNRRLTWKSGLAAAAVLAALVTLTWWLARGPAAPVQHDPVSVVVADFANTSGEAAFDRTLEPVLKLALEGAGFISAYDRTSISRNLGVKPPEKLDEHAATEIAVKQGLGVVLSGAVAREGYRYLVSIRATQAVSGQEIAKGSKRVTTRDQVLAAITELATSVREALGDDTSGSAQRFAMETLSATSLEVIREYAGAMEALSRSRFETARQGFKKAVTLDPNFGLAYAGLAIASKNLDQQQEAEQYVKEALAHVDGMTERERYRTRGLFYYLTSDYPACVREYGDLIKRFAADAAARNNLALCQTYLRQLPQAVEQMQQVVKILPNRALYRENLTLYSDYSGDFAGAEKEVAAMQERGLFGLVGLAFAQLGQGRPQDAARTYLEMGNVDQQGASYTAAGLGDLAMYEGRLGDAVQLLTAGANADRQANAPDRAATKLAAIADAQLMLKQDAAAIIAAEEALANSRSVKIRFLAGRIFAEADAPARAREIAAGLSAELQREPQAYGKILEGLLAMRAQDPRAAIQRLTEATTLLDAWIGHFELGRAYLLAGALPQADSEFDRCIKRRGEALALFLDEEPTFAFFPPVYYYQGRVKESLKSAKAADAYRAYLDIRGNSKEDPLAADARRRIPSP
jgi:tetratricopeptide (TPR) repeat protein